MCEQVVTVSWGKNDLLTQLFLGDRG